MTTISKYTKREKTEVYLLDCRPLKNRELFERLFHEQDEARKEKILRCRDEGERRLSLGGGCLLRFALEDRGIEPGKLSFGPDGAPKVEGAKAWISLSHSGDYAMAAVSPQPVAVDVEQWEPGRMYIAEHFFTEGEKAALAAAPSPCEEFHRIWSRKECLIKRDGLRDLRELDTFAPQEGTFHDFPLEGYSCICLCSEGQRTELRVADFFRWENRIF